TCISALYNILLHPATLLRNNTRFSSTKKKTSKKEKSAANCPTSRSFFQQWAAIKGFQVERACLIIKRTRAFTCIPYLHVSVFFVDAKSSIKIRVFPLLLMRAFFALAIKNEARLL